ncbi:MAG: lipocalin family protein [Bacteroidales bacterium]
MKNISLIIIITLLMFSCKSTNVPTRAKSVDLEKYAGTWYEIARYPVSFEEGCSCVTATYKPRGRYVRVINRCKKNGESRDIKGKAFPVKGSNNTRLKVRFFWPFSAGYWIIGLDDEYQWALVGSPSKKYCWILARDKTISTEELKYITDIMHAEGYDKNRLHFTKHNCHE